jgi:thiol:disulfide interchange protein DsbC
MTAFRLSLSLSLMLLALVMVRAPLASAAPGDSATGVAVPDGASTALLASLRTSLPGTRFLSASPTPIPGVYEVILSHGKVAYTDSTGRYFLFGHLFDMQSQRDLTAERAVDSKRVSFSGLPLENSIHVVHGSGRRVLAVFSDPDCPYCRRLETVVDRLDDASIYIFPFPLTSLHPDSAEKTAAIWCSTDRAAAWSSAMHTGRLGAKPKVTDACREMVARNVALGERLGIDGTPTLISSDGRVYAGSMDVSGLSSWLDRAPTAPPVSVSMRGADK